MELLLFDKATFLDSHILEIAYAAFSEDAVYWNSQFSTSNLVFTFTLFIYYLVINPGVFNSNSSVWTEWCSTQKIIQLNTMNKNFA